jgi:hypothetical protein
MGKFKKTRQKGKKEKQENNRKKTKKIITNSQKNRPSGRFLKWIDEIPYSQYNEIRCL